jgi:predicted NAD-dependent protein-ADP-ribosyltransferase YbiA (DUF1768 family)
MSNHYLPQSTLDGRYSPTAQRHEGGSGRQWPIYQSGFVANREYYPRNDNSHVPSAEVPAHRRFARDAPRTHPMDHPDYIPREIEHVPTYQLGKIHLLLDVDSQSSGYPFTRKYYRPDGQPLFVDENETVYYSVHHYIQLRMILFFSGKVPESEPHFRLNEELRKGAEYNATLYEEARQTIHSIHDLRRFMKQLKLRHFNFDFWYQSQTILQAMLEANMMKYQQNPDLKAMLLSLEEHPIFMEVSGFNQCFFGSGYEIEFLERNRHFYTLRPSLWRGWNNFGESLSSCRRLLLQVRSLPLSGPEEKQENEEEGNVAKKKRDYSQIRY